MIGPVIETVYEPVRLAVGMFAPVSIWSAEELPRVEASSDTRRPSFQPSTSPVASLRTVTVTVPAT